MVPPILFYDGTCGLCDASVRWCLRHDRRGVLSYAPLHGSTFSARVAEPIPMTDSVLLSDEAGTHIESDAVVGILRHFGGRWAIPRILLQVIPRPLRDAGYRVVARNRRRWFGGAEQCRLPDVSDRDRLLP